MKIAVIDYGMGNLFSVEQALNRLGADVIVTSNAADFEKVDGIVLPGVGAFPDAMARLVELELIAPIQKTTKPLLGICLGMQLLFEESEEVRKTKGLGILKGRIEKFKNVSRIPHIGWNELTFTDGVHFGQNYVYFVHSFYANETLQEEVIAYTDYEGVKVPAIVGRHNFTGMQFHPEKSGEFGMHLLQEWLQKVGVTVC